MNTKTNVHVDAETLKKTTQCNKNFSCLYEKNKICQVELNVDDKIHFVKCRSKESCNYRRSFGYSFVCLCPVRKELFNRYNI